MTRLRAWQQEASEKFYGHSGVDFLTCATPGAGKTTFALTIGKRMLDKDEVSRVMVVVPTDALRQQWADNAASFGISLMPVTDAVDYAKPGYDGCVATYSQLATGAGADLARAAARTPTLVIIDEIHHAGTSCSWGDALVRAAGPARRRLALTGTPWRKDPTQPIPFVRYDDERKVIVDYAYEYGEAVADGVCRRVEFHAYDGEAEWIDPARAYREAARRKEADHDAIGARRDGTRFKAQLGADMRKEDVSPALEAIHHPHHEWMPKVLAEASAMLDELRAEVADAAGLVVAEGKWQAREYAKLLKEITGEMPPVVVSDTLCDPGSKLAKAAIDRFRTGRGRWIVAVRMISEGVDIPRLAVGVYASTIHTPLFFRQVVGRFVRVRPGEEFNARLLIPAVPDLLTHARDIEEELRHQLELETEQEKRERAAGEQITFDLRQPLAASEAMLDRAILAGKDATADELEAARRECLAHGIPTQYAMNVAAVLKGTGVVVAAAPEPVVPVAAPARFRREKILRGDVEELSRKLGYLLAGREPGGATKATVGAKTKLINSELMKRWAPRNEATVEQLEQMREYLCDRLGMPR